jgi:hypothetical protein
MNLRTRLLAAGTTLLGLWALNVPLARADMVLGYQLTGSGLLTGSGALARRRAS